MGNTRYFSSTIPIFLIYISVLFTKNFWVRTVPTVQRVSIYKRKLNQQNGSLMPLNRDGVHCTRWPAKLYNVLRLCSMASMSHLTETEYIVQGGLQNCGVAKGLFR